MQRPAGVRYLGFFAKIGRRFCVPTMLPATGHPAGVDRDPGSPLDALVSFGEEPPAGSPAPAVSPSGRDGAGGSVPPAPSSPALQLPPPSDLNSASLRLASELSPGVTKLECTVLATSESCPAMLCCVFGHWRMLVADKCVYFCIVSQFLDVMCASLVGGRRGTCPVPGSLLK